MDSHAFLIGIAGGTGSGKTSIAQAIAADFPPLEVVLIEQDSYYRDLSKICVTESPADAYVIDSSTDYNGYFFVLDGNLSPLDGRGPIEVGIKKLQKRLEEKNVSELILATSTTIEGEATAHYVHQLASNIDIKVSRIAFGIPLNGEIGYLDSETISHAFNERKVI